MALDFFTRHSSLPLDILTEIYSKYSLLIRQEHKTITDFLTKKNFSRNRYSVTFQPLSPIIIRTARKNIFDNCIKLLTRSAISYSFCTKTRKEIRYINTARSNKKLKDRVGSIDGKNISTEHNYPCGVALKPEDCQENISILVYNHNCHHDYKCSAYVCKYDGSLSTKLDDQAAYFGFRVIEIEITNYVIVC